MYSNRHVLVGAVTGWFALATSGFGAEILPPPQVPFGGQPSIRAIQAAEPMAWDAETKETTLKVGETTAHVSFGFTNVSAKEVSIMNVRPSCGCTLVKLPSYPWKIPPGGSGTIDASVDLRGKRGTLYKTLDVGLSTGSKRLTMKLTIPDQPIEMAADDRLRNQELAMADRQAVFKGECARCHLVPALGRTGKILFQAACAICHEAEHRATMVPDLRSVKSVQDHEYWIRWITFGRHGSLMPAFSRYEGGPFTESQIDSLVKYLAEQFPHDQPAPGPTVKR